MLYRHLYLCSRYRLCTIVLAVKGCTVLQNGHVCMLNLKTEVQLALSVL